jgi:hypothetical protein
MKKLPSGSVKHLPKRVMTLSPRRRLEEERILSLGK